MKLYGNVVRVKTLVDSSVRLEIDLGEMGIPHMARLAQAQADGTQVMIEVGYDSESIRAANPGRPAKRRTAKDADPPAD